MREIEYFDVQDKTGWGDGPWQREPDKIQWPDEVTGLPCLMVRGPSGSWCGYVGVHPYHPAAGVHYDGIRDDDAERNQAAFKRNTSAWAKAGYPDLITWMQEHPLDTVRDLVPMVGEAICQIEVHGGLTFASGCTPIDQSKWEELCAREVALRAEAERFPVGDAARALAFWAGAFDSYQAFAVKAQRSFVCHLPEPGEPDDVWWFGFDCAHAGDVIPGMTAHLREINRRMPGWPEGWPQEQYRDVAYVRAECARLAQQLAQIAALVPNQESR